MLLEAIAALLTVVRPNYVTMETYHGHLPAKALEKYRVICDKFERCGYEICDQFRDPATGIDYWYFGPADIEKDAPKS